MAQYFSPTSQACESVLYLPIAQLNVLRRAPGHNGDDGWIQAYGFFKAGG
jgi:hypothetical protein